MARRSRISPNRIGVAHRDALDVRHRQGETRPLQQRAEIAHIGEGRDARADAAFDLRLGGGEGLAQLGQGRAAEHAGEEQAVGP